MGWHCYRPTLARLVTAGRISHQDHCWVSQAPPSPPPPTAPLPPPQLDLPWHTIFSSPVASQIQVAWGHDPTTLAWLRSLITPRHPDRHTFLLTTVTSPGSRIRFRYWRTTPGPPAPWFHPPPHDALAADYVMKARAASGLNHDPTHHGTLSQSPEDYSLLLDHAIAIGLLPSHHSLDDFTSPDYSTSTHINLSPTALHDYGDPTAPYSSFHAPSSPPPSPDMALCYTDSRFSTPYDFLWDDLLQISNPPNYCHHSDAGYRPLHLPEPHLETERIRWAISSLCHHTLSAISHLFGPPTPLPPPRPPRANRTRPKPAPPLPPAAPRPPPPAPPRHLEPPTHTGVPPGNGWFPHLPASYSSTMDTLSVGGHFLSFQGMSTTTPPSLTVSSLNINGLTPAKLTEVLWWLQHEHIDVLTLIDTRCTQKTSASHCRTIRSTLGPGCYTHSSPARPASQHLPGHSEPSHHDLVGGQLFAQGQGKFRAAPRCTEKADEEKVFEPLLSCKLEALRGGEKTLAFIRGHGLLSLLASGLPSQQSGGIGWAPDSSTRVVHIELTNLLHLALLPRESEHFVSSAALSKATAPPTIT